MEFICTNTPLPAPAFHFCPLIKSEGRVVPRYFHKPLSYTGPVRLQLSLGGLFKKKKLFWEMWLQLWESLSCYPWELLVTETLTFAW